ncbi:hypothetical protein CONLIGDRAFT_646091 [Coniochaeta ligniaria NRRL 30616]|uniref:Rhodopsin domain-containing protein n=1 Tax=Coniochaeta ligniaria NRRL 30616 TaxID=1408157 RepID=A0A1J7IK71_9PEZI|nr:hypothetical protein CONLIGDRAFT_646091 [Coniochaeta ligniaria NRRL 30616]
MADILGAFAVRDDAASSNTTAGAGTATPTFTKDPGPVVIAAIWSMFAISSCFLILRVYCRAIRTRAMWWDDYLLIAGWVFLLASNATITELMRIGFGLTLDFKPESHTISTVSDDLNKFALALTKTSFAVTLLRVAQGWQKWLIWFLIGSMNLLLAINAITTWMAACDRVGIDHYNAVLPACWGVMDSVIVAMVANAYSAIVDFVLALLPWKIILSLQMKMHEKIGVAIAMSLGLLYVANHNLSPVVDHTDTLPRAGIVGIMKIVQITTITGGEDIPYRLSLLFIWGQAEPNATVIAASIPVLRVLFRDISRTMYGNSGGRTANGYLRSDTHSKFNHNNTNVTTGETKLDDSSDKSILSPGKTKNSIVRTTSVAVNYDARRESDEEAGVFEMTDQLPIQRPYEGPFGGKTGEVGRAS